MECPEKSFENKKEQADDTVSQQNSDDTISQQSSSMISEKDAENVSDEEQKLEKRPGYKYYCSNEDCEYNYNTQGYNTKQFECLNQNFCSKRCMKQVCNKIRNDKEKSEEERAKNKRHFSMGGGGGVH